jgi:hypothetical protein
VDEVRIPPSGNPFTAAPDETPHACNDGWVTIGQVVEDPETGEEIIEYALYLCRRCAERRSDGALTSEREEMRSG